MSKNQKNHNKHQKKVDNTMRYLQTPCTIKEATQIARGVAEDVMADYHHQSHPLLVSMSLQIEILKDTLINAGLITEEEFIEKYTVAATEYNQQQQEALTKMMEEELQTDEEEEESEVELKMETKVSDIEVQTF